MFDRVDGMMEWIHDKLEELTDFLMEWIDVLMLPALIGLVLFAILVIIVGGRQDYLIEQQIKQCYMEERENTPECKYLIYKHSNDRSNSTRVTPIIVHRM